MDKVAFLILVFCILHSNARVHGPFTIQLHTDNGLNEEEEIDTIIGLNEVEEIDTIIVPEQSSALSENEDSDSLPTTVQPDVSDDDDDDDDDEYDDHEEDDDHSQETLAEIERITKRNYVKWVAGFNGNFSDDAVMVTRGDGSKVVICRVNHNGGVIPGKLLPGESACRFGTDRIEHQTSSYEVLTDPKNATFWIPFTTDAMKYAVHGGHREYRPTATLNVVRAEIHGILTPGKQWIEDGTCSVPFNGGEYFIYPFEILVYA